MVHSAKAQLAQMARYHAWATERLLASVAAAPDESYYRPCGLFFGSIHGTLNHLLLTDGEMWLPRFLRTPVTSLALDAELERDRARLASRLNAAAARWSGFVETLDEPALAGDLPYIMSTGRPRVLQVASALQHVFNHATHHRGQVTAALSMLGLECQPLDLPLMIFAELGDP